MNDEQADAWIVVRDDGFFGPPRFSARKFIKHSKSRVYYDDGHRERFVSEDKVAAFGLAEQAAKLAEAKLRSSRELYDQERRAAEVRAKERAAKILLEAAIAEAPPLSPVLSA